MLSHLHLSLETDNAVIQPAIGPDASGPELWAASEEATGEAEEKAARKLGVPALAVVPRPGGAGVGVSVLSAIAA
jgi:hypothetical protein